MSVVACFITNGTATIDKTINQRQHKTQIKVMAQNSIPCPTLENILEGESCYENFAGTSSVVYVGIKADLASPMEREDNVYSTPVFKSGKGLYRFDCKDEAQKMAYKNLGYRNGFEITGTFVLEEVSKLTSRVGRALNNLSLFYIMPDSNGDTLIMYDPIKKCKIGDGDMTGDTGAAPSDDRVTTVNVKLSPAPYGHLYVTPPQTGGWDSLLADAGSSD